MRIVIKSPEMNFVDFN